MVNLINKETRELFHYFLSIKKYIDNQSKVLNIQDKDILRLMDFDEEKNVYMDKEKKIYDFIKSKRADKNTFISRGLIVDKENEKRYPFIMKRYSESDNEEQSEEYDEGITFPLETLPKNLSSDYELITLKKKFIINRFAKFREDNLIKLVEVIKTRINELPNYYIEDGYFIIKKSADNKLIYNEFNTIINELKSDISLPKVFNLLFMDNDVIKEIACTGEEDRELSENIIIEGPAGTGKSQKVIELALKMLSEGKRVLITSLRDGGLQALENRFPKVIQPLIFSYYNDDVGSQKYRERFEEIEKGNSMNKDKLKEIINNLEGGSRFRNQHAKNLNKKLYEYVEGAIKLIEKINYQHLDIIFRKSDVLVDIPSKNTIVSKIEEIKNKKDEIDKHFEILADWKINYEINFDEEQLMGVIEYGKILINKIKGSYAERILLESGNEAFLEGLKDFVFNLKSHIYFVMKKLEIKPASEGTVTDSEIKLIEKRLSSFKGNKETEEKNLIQLKKDIVNEFNINAKTYGYSEIDDEKLFLIGKTIEELEICINWESEIEIKIKKYLGNVSFYRDKKLNTIEELDNLVIKVKSMKEIKDYFGVLNYIEKLKMSLYIEDDFKELFVAIKELNVYKVEEQYILVDRLRELLPSVMKLKSYLNKLYDVLYIPLDKILKMYNNPKDRWRAVINALKRYEYKNKYYNSSNCNVENSSNKNLVILKCWYHFLKEYKIEYNNVFNQLVDSDNIEFKDIKNIFKLVVMPINKVIEWIPPKEGGFDAVIIEDCNQCEISYISLLLRGKNFIITGDEKQYNPKFSGIDKKIIENNLKAYFKDSKKLKEFNYFNNLYQILEKYASLKIQLTEQYRCNEDITNLLNENFYNNKIIQKVKNDPKFKAINSVYVEEGVREKDKVINYKEAEGIVEQIIKCIKNPIYNNKTIGVISLLGNEQGELISKLLREKITNEEIEKRKIACGDFYCLQGEERDIVFLSMVVGNNVKFVAQTKENDYKRFNHALSRARDQLWLFHSIGLKDINKECIRYKILQYFMSEKSDASETA